jgi:hypothetical protein
MDLGTYRYYVDWDNGPGQSPPVEPFLGAFDDISAYALKADWSYGSDSGTPGQTKAGSASITLDNSSSLFSSYNTLSDIYGKILPGIWVRITMTIGAGAEVTMWQGKLDSIVPRVGDRVTVSTATLQAYGSLQQASADADIDIPMQTDITTGAAADLILDAAGYPAADRDIDTGLSTMSRFWARKGRVLDLLRELEAQETGLLRETKDGKIQFESRAHRASAPHTTARSTYGTGTLRPWNLQQEDPLLDIFNSIEAKVRTFNKSETVALATICDVRNGTGGPPIPFANGETKVIDIEFPTPSSPSQLLAVETWGIVTVEINTTEAGDGTDLTNLVTMSRQELGRTLRCTFVNSSGSAGYFIRLFVSGVAIVEGDPLTVSAEDTTSQAKFRKRALPNPSQWLTQLAEGQAYCNHIIALYKDPRPALRFTLKANYNATHLAEAQAIDVSDRIHITANLGTFGLGINGDFFVESLHHKVNEGRVHEVQVYCRSIVTHSWPASGTAYSARTVPDGVPDDLYVTGMDPDLQIVCGARAWKYNRNITGARFRARYYAEPLASGESADLRTIVEGGDMEDNLAGGMIVVDTPFFANQYGAQYDFVSGAEGAWYYAFQFTSSAGDSVWTDGNKTPQYVENYVQAVSGQAATGPPDDWWVEVIADPSGRHAVIVRASRPKVNGAKIWAWVAQIKDNRTGLWRSVGDNTASVESANVFYGDQNDSAYGDIAHVPSKNNTRFTRGTNIHGGLRGQDPLDFARIGDLLLFDPRGGVWEEKYCSWGTIDRIQGLTSGFDIATADNFDVRGRFRTAVTSDLRLLSVKPPWEWTIEGYFGAEPNHGLYERWYWDNDEHGDTTTAIFVSDPIEVPASVPLSAIEARVWFDSGFSRWDGGIITGGLVGSEGNPSGATGLQILTHEDEPQIPAGYIALQWNRETLNYKDISVVAAWFSSALPAEGPYDAERTGHPTTVLEEGTCEVVRGNKRINVTRPSPPAASVIGKIFLMYTDDASPDSDLDGNVITAATATTITLSDRSFTSTNPFMRTGTFNYAIVDCWWPNEGSSNLAYYQWQVTQVTQDIEATVWRTPVMPMPNGTYYVTLANRNPYGLGTRLIPGGAGTPDPPTEVHPQACTILSVVAVGSPATLEVDTNADLGSTFSITSASNFTLKNPAGTLYCGQTILWMITGAGVPTLDTKFRLMDGESISKSSGRDLLGAIYNAADDEWDAFWKKGS